MLRTPSEQVDFLEEEIKKMSDQKVCLFLACICERLYPAYQLTTHNKSWSRRAQLRKSLDLVWENILPNATIVDAPDFEFDAYFKDDNPEEDGMTPALYVAETVGSIECLYLYMSERKKYKDDKEAGIYCLRDIVSAAFNVLDSVIYGMLDLEVTKENDDKVNRHKLMKTEIEAQNRVLLEIKSNEITDQLMQKMRKRSENEPLICGEWRPESD